MLRTTEVLFGSAAMPTRLTTGCCGHSLFTYTRSTGVFDFTISASSILFILLMPSQQKLNSIYSTRTGLSSEVCLDSQAMLLCIINSSGENPYKFPQEEMQQLLNIL